MDTLKLCLELRDAGYNPEAKSDPVAWNLKCDALPEEEKNKGWYWRENPIEGWYPDLGRKAYIEEIKKVVGDEVFAVKHGPDSEKLHQSQSHELWCRELINVIKKSNDKSS